MYRKYVVYLSGIYTGYVLYLSFHMTKHLSIDKLHTICPKAVVVVDMSTCPAHFLHSSALHWTVTCPYDQTGDGTLDISYIPVHSIMGCRLCQIPFSKHAIQYLLHLDDIYLDLDDIYQISATSIRSRRHILDLDDIY